MRVRPLEQWRTARELRRRIWHRLDQLNIGHPPPDGSSELHVSRIDPDSGPPVPHEWAARPEDRQLVAAVNDFLKSYYKSAGYNLCYRKYFESRGIGTLPQFGEKAHELATGHVLV